MSNEVIRMRSKRGRSIDVVVTPQRRHKKPLLHMPHLRNDRTFLDRCRAQEEVNDEFKYRITQIERSRQVNEMRQVFLYLCDHLCQAPDANHFQVSSVDDTDDKGLELLLNYLDQMGFGYTMGSKFLLDGTFAKGCQDHAEEAGDDKWCIHFAATAANTV